MRKWKKGKAIESMDELIGQEFVWINGKVYHRGWFQSWQLRSIVKSLYNGRIYSVEKIEKGDKNEL